MVWGYTMYLSRESDGGPKKGPLMLDISRSLYLGQKKKNCYVAFTRPKFENWVGRSIFYYFFFTYRERVEFSNIF